MNNQSSICFGLQKMTLLDFPGKVACTIFIPSCNFRCPFCHNASLVVRQVEEYQFLSFQEIKKFLEKRQGLLDGVCVSGGEPLQNKNIFEFLGFLKDLQYKVKLDTNGSYPDRLGYAIDNHLIDAVAMDVKNSAEKYSQTIGVEGYYEKVKESIDILKREPVSYCEFRTTVVNGLHTEKNLLEIATLLKGAQNFFLQKFIDSGDLIGKGLKAIPEIEMKRILIEIKKIIPTAELRGY